MGEFGGDGDDYGTESGGETGGEVSEGTTETSTTETCGTEGLSSSAAAEVGTEIGHGMSMENTAVTSISEFSINPSSTTEGTNQILETPMSLEQAQQSVENHHHQSLGQIMEMNGQFIPDSQKERIGNGAQDIKAVEYNPGSRVTGSFSFHNNKSSIRVSNINETQLERTTKHETNHFASFNREIIVPGEKGYTVHKTSGVRQSSYFHPSQGQEVPISSKNRGMNEGITTMYTNQQLEAMDPAKAAEAARQTGYAHATELSQELENIVGKETIAQAYYGGNISSLESKVNELGGEKAFENLSRCMDKVTYTTDPSERMSAMREAQDILATMSERQGKK